jgi:SAM-dependent methyltransferase
VNQRARFAILPRLGLRPALADTLTDRLDAAFADLETNAAPIDGQVGPAIDALDAGCGRRSALTRYRGRIRRFVGIDVHEPRPGSLPHLDSFALVDVCGDPGAIEPGSYDVVLSSFTVEHFASPARAFANIRRWLRPGGRLVITTVNRRHPFVALYLGLPGWLQRPLQRQLKASAADAHPLVGSCNDPAKIQKELEAAGFTDVRLATVPNLSRAWGRHLPFYVLGLLGDLLTQPFAGRRSTIVADGRVPR